MVDVRRLEPQESDGNVDEWIEGQAMTLEDLDALADRAHREAAEVQVEYDPVNGFPTDVYIEWIRDAVDDEIGYTVTDYSAL